MMNRSVEKKVNLQDRNAVVGEFLSKHLNEHKRDHLANTYTSRQLYDELTDIVNQDLMSIILPNQTIAERQLEASKIKKPKLAISKDNITILGQPEEDEDSEDLPVNVDDIVEDESDSNGPDVQDYNFGDLNEGGDQQNQQPNEPREEAPVPNPDVNNE